MLVLNNMELYKISLNETAIALDFSLPIANVFHWDQHSQQVIANILINGTTQFVNIDLASLTYKPINSKKVLWAAKREDGTLLFTDHMERLWHTQGIEEQLITPLIGQLDKEQRFALNDSLLFGVNKENQLWRYDFVSEQFDILAELGPDIDYITDIKGDELLATIVVAAKKEVVELSLKY